MTKAASVHDHSLLILSCSHTFVCPVRCFSQKDLTKMHKATKQKLAGPYHTHLSGMGGYPAEAEWQF